MRLPFYPQHSLWQHFYPAFVNFCVFAVPARTQQDRSPLRLRNDAAVPYSQAPIVSPASCACSFPARAENETANTSRPSASGGPAYPLNYIARLFVDGAPVDFCGEPTWTIIPRISETPVVKPTSFVKAQEFLVAQPAYAHAEPPQRPLSPKLPSVSSFANSITEEEVETPVAILSTSTATNCRNV